MTWNFKCDECGKSHPANRSILSMFSDEHVFCSLDCARRWEEESLFPVGPPRAVAAKAPQENDS